MGIRLEFILFVLITIVVVGSFNIELNTNIKKQEVFTKELDFTYTTFREVDTKTLKAIAYGTYGVRDTGVLTMQNFVYSTEVIESLVAQKGTYMGNIIYLEGDVVFTDNNGYNCETEQSEYDQSTEILNITAPYVATRGNNIILGDTLTYNTRIKEAYGTVIDAVLYTSDK